MKTTHRATFGGRLSAVLVTAGSAVGLGNIWRFPYVAGENGGGAFLLIYILSVLLLGVPIMLSEFAIGRNTHRNAVGAYRTLSSRWSILGYNSILAPLLIMGFYLVVSGWTLEYMIHSLTGEFTRISTPEAYESLFNAFTQNPWKPLLYTVVFTLLTHGVIALGVQKGIERSARIMMPLLLLILVVLAVHSILLPGGTEGVKFLFAPDFSKVTPSTVLTALGQAFFSLSIGLGCLVTYASYFKNDTNITHTALQVAFIDTLVAVLAGLVIFPAVFSVGIEPTAGPSLVFVTLPAIFNTLPLSMVDDLLPAAGHRSPHLHDLAARGADRLRAGGVASEPPCGGMDRHRRLHRTGCGRFVVARRMAVVAARREIVLRPAGLRDGQHHAARRRFLHLHLHGLGTRPAVHAGGTDQPRRTAPAPLAAARHAAALGLSGGDPADLPG